MSDKNIYPYRMAFTPEDVQLVESFRRRTETSVLTIMFTDIVGFTAFTEAKGDLAANELRWQHDEIVASAIEEGGAGQIIKHIGDAVLAVFSEPSAGVERALRIQARLREFNRSRDESEQLLVRIGLHMGQVTTEDSVDLDVFGRHVNRASRVERLAEGGQILVTYPVFDSARGWLDGAEEEAWVLHGEYYVKGLPEPIAVYEVYALGSVRPRRPRGAPRKRSHAALLALVLAVILAAAGAWLAILLSPGKDRFGPSSRAGSSHAATVWLLDMPQAPVYLDQGTRLSLKSVPGQDEVLALTKIPVGVHLLHWTLNRSERQYAHITVIEGDNHLHPRFVPNPLPALSRYVQFPGDGPHQETHVRSASYFTYDGKNQPQKHKADLAMSVEIAEDKADTTKLIFTYMWTILVDGKELDKDTLAVSSTADSKKRIEDSKTVWKDAFHSYEIEYRITGLVTQFSVRGVYAPIPAE